VSWREELGSISPISTLAEETLRREWVRGYKRPQTGWQHHLKTNRWQGGVFKLEYKVGLWITRVPEVWMGKPFFNYNKVKL
jgi:hypothetical protein